METVFHGVPLEDIYYLGGVMREADRVFSWGALDDYDSLPLKFVDFFLQTKLGDMYDWFFLMDDDTYLYIDRLGKRIAFLEGKEDGVHPEKDVYSEGFIWTHLAHTQWGVYLSGGAGTLLTVKAYQDIQEWLRGIVLGGDLYTPPHVCADICLGLWIKELADHRMVHDDGYHTEMAQIGEAEQEGALTFHHLKEKEDFWAHWRVGRENQAVKQN